MVLGIQSLACQFEMLLIAGRMWISCLVIEKSGLETLTRWGALGGTSEIDPITSNSHPPMKNPACSQNYRLLYVSMYTLM